MQYMYTMEYHSVIRKKERMPFAASWMDPDCHTQWNKLDKERQVYMISLLCRILKKNTNELNYKRERDRLREWIYDYQVGRVWGRINRELETDRYTLLYYFCGRSLLVIYYFNFLKYLFIWPHQILVAACGIFVASCRSFIASTKSPASHVLKSCSLWAF